MRLLDMMNVNVVFRDVVAKVAGFTEILVLIGLSRGRNRGKPVSRL